MKTYGYNQRTLIKLRAREIERNKICKNVFDRQMFISLLEMDALNIVFYIGQQELNFINMIKP